MCTCDGPACLILLYQQEVLRGYCKQKSPGHRGWSDRVVCTLCARVRMPYVISTYNITTSVRVFVRPRADPQTRARDAHHRNRWRGTHLTVMPLRPERRKCIVRVSILFCFFTANRAYLHSHRYLYGYIVVYNNTSRLYMRLFFLYRMGFFLTGIGQYHTIVASVVRKHVL